MFYTTCGSCSCFFVWDVLKDGLVMFCDLFWLVVQGLTSTWRGWRLSDDSRMREDLQQGLSMRLSYFCWSVVFMRFQDLLCPFWWDAKKIGHGLESFLKQTSWNLRTFWNNPFFSECCSKHSCSEKERKIKFSNVLKPNSAADVLSRSFCHISQRSEVIFLPFVLRSVSWDDPRKEGWEGQKSWCLVISGILLVL